MNSNTTQFDDNSSISTSNSIISRVKDTENVDALNSTEATPFTHTMAARSLQEFTLFGKLPIELRLRIWKEHMRSTGPRVIEVLWSATPGYYTDCPTPPVLHVCMESRLYALERYKAVIVGNERHQNNEITSNTTTSTSSDQQPAASQPMAPFGAYMDFAQDSLYPSLGNICLDDYLGKVCQFFSMLGDEAAAKLKHIMFMPAEDDEHRIFSRFTGLVTFNIPMSDISMCWLGRTFSPNTAPRRLVVGLQRVNLQESIYVDRWDNTQGAVISKFVGPGPDRVSRTWVPDIKRAFLSKGYDKSLIDSLDISLVDIVRGDLRT